MVDSMKQSIDELKLVNCELKDQLTEQIESNKQPRQNADSFVAAKYDCETSTILLVGNPKYEQMLKVVQRAIIRLKVGATSVLTELITARNNSKNITTINAICFLSWIVDGSRNTFCLKLPQQNSGIKF